MTNEYWYEIYNFFKVRHAFKGYSPKCLDVACGERPTGDVNIDLHIEHTGHRSIALSKLEVERIPNFICADMHNLPFRDDMFDEVYSSNAIEHTIRPFKMLKEMVRVSAHHVKIICPHRFLIRHLNTWLKQYHVSHITKRWLGEASKLLGLRVKISEYSKHRGFPSVYVPIVQLPSEITFVGVKHKRRC